jgi:amino acid transporter
MTRCCARASKVISLVSMGSRVTKSLSLWLGRIRCPPTPGLPLVDSGCYTEATDVRQQTSDVSCQSTEATYGRGPTARDAKGPTLTATSTRSPAPGLTWPLPCPRRVSGSPELRLFVISHLGVCLSMTDTAASNRLRANAIGVPGAIAMSIAIMAPAAGMMFVPQVVAGYAGAAVPLVYLISLVGSLFVANTIVEFSRRLVHAGSFYGFNSAGLGGTFGFLSGWLLFAGYFVFYPQNLLAFGPFTSTVLQDHFGIHISWVVFTVLAAALIWFLSTRGISTSMTTDLYSVAFEIVVVLAVVAVILLHGGATGSVVEPRLFSPSSSPTSWGGVFFGMIFGVMTFMGFEAAATVAEETSEPRRNIPRAIWGAVVGIGIFYLVTTYAMALGYGPAHGADFGKATAPMDYLAGRYGNGLLVGAVDIAGMISSFAVALACNNAAVRVIYAMGRDGVLFKQAGTTHPRYLTPTVAINAVGLAAIILSLVVGLGVDPYPDGYGFFGAFGSLPILVLYVLTSLSLILYIRKSDPAQFSVLRHFVLPIAGALVMLLPIYGSIFPIPAWPYNLILGLVFVWIVLGLAVGFVLRKRSAELLDRLGQLMAS